MSNILRRSERKALVTSDHDEWIVRFTIRSIFDRLNKLLKIDSNSEALPRVYYIPNTLIPKIRVQHVHELYKNMLYVMPYMYHKIETLQVKNNSTYRRYKKLMKVTYDKAKEYLGRFIPATYHHSVVVCRNALKKYCKEYEIMRDKMWGTLNWRGQQLPIVILNEIESYLT
jgi:hypothetical protein